MHACEGRDENLLRVTTGLFRWTLE